MKAAGKVLLAAGLAASMALAGPSGNVSVQNLKLRNGLAEAVRGAEAGQMLPVVIVLREQTPRDQIEAASRIRDKGERRAAVMGLLRETANRTQGGILAMLEAGRQTGSVGERVRALSIANVIAADVTAEMAVALAARGDVAYLHLDKFLGEEVFPVQPERGDVVEGGDVTAAITCGVNKVRAPEVWNMGITGDGIVVGVIDTGLCRTHPDIVNQVWVNPGEIANNGIDDDGNGYVDDINGWNFQNNNNNVNDSNGHGTHVAGTVAGDGTNGQQTGVAPDAKIMVLEFWNSFSGESTVWEGMEYGAANGADIITASLGWPHSVGPDRAMWRMVSENTFAAGVVTTFAAGNEGGSINTVDDVRTPGDVPDMITVGATDCNDAIAGFSSRGPVTWQNIAPYFDWPHPPGKLKPTISGPGVDTQSLDAFSCSGYTFLSGTSMATPHNAGVMALILQANPNLDHFQVKQILKDTAIDLGTAGADNVYGFGRIDAVAAVELAMSMGCPGDLDGDGDVDGDDFFDYLDAFAADDLDVCDIDGDGDCDADDFFDYLDVFSAGC